MSEDDNNTEQVDNWVFDSLVNFLHGSIWKVPVVGFIEEKSVVFDPDSYNNMTEEKEEEFRKIHEEYKGVVDFMLSSFMEDLQVTPEQVEEACRVREHQSKTLPESHITKIALEQLWAAEDFTAFRRLMTRKNIDLQLQSLELLVAKYGVLSPALRSGDTEEPTGDDGEDDFLQVVIRYSDQLELFKCDYGAEGSCLGKAGLTNNPIEIENKSPIKETGNSGYEGEGEESKNMKLHLSGIRFKNDVAPTPVQYQAMLTSSCTSLHSTSSRPSSVTKVKSQKQSSAKAKNIENINIIPSEVVEEIQDAEGKDPEQEDCIEILALTTPPPPPTTPSQFNEASPSSLSIPNLPEEVHPLLLDYSADNPIATEKESSGSPLPVPEDNYPVPISSPPPNSQENPSAPSSPSPTVSCHVAPGETSDSPLPDPDPNDNSVEPVSEIEACQVNQKIESEANNNGEKPVEVKQEDAEESQLIQLEEAEASMESGSKKVEEANDEEPRQQEEAPSYEEALKQPVMPASALLSPNYDEKTVADIASTAPEQRRLLTAVRKALEINPEKSESATAIDIPSTLENDEDLQKRREYLRAQRDKLIAIKKQEREKLLLANTSGAGSSQQPARPKSARAAHIALKNPNNMRAASLGEKSLSARRALADRLKQELIEK